MATNPRSEQEEYVARYQDLKARNVRIRKIPHGLLLAIVTVVTLGVLGILAYKAGPWYVAVAALLVFGGYLAWIIYERKRQGESPPEPGDSAECPGPDG
ncbi:MAG: hypothetical protein MI923_20470 [Phycisphaerales bacterium]|nr:hypothetical protein [Phycisphaerales bacterium]